MVTKGIVFGYKISTTRLEVDQAMVSVIETLKPPTTVKGIRSFLGHVGFYRRFIKDFSKISRSLCRLLERKQSLKLMKSVNVHLKISMLGLSELLSWQHQTGARILKSCVMLVIMQWEQFLGREQRKSSKPYTMPKRLLMKHKRTTQLQKKS